MIGYKTLQRGAVGRHSGFRWPTPTGDVAGDWVVVEGTLRPATNGIHACRLDQLPLWLDMELWVCELGEPVEQAASVLLSRRGRLLRLITEWNDDATRAFVTACVERCRTHAVDALRTSGEPDKAAALEIATTESLTATAASAARDVYPPLATLLLDTADVSFAAGAGMSACLIGFLSSRVARGVAGVVGGSGPDAELEERGWQARWLADRLSLGHGGEGSEP